MFFVLLFVFSAIASFSQQEYFVYLQADNHQPFYARINSRIYSSTENGYMIIPKLGDSIYDVAIGFSKNAFPEQRFSILINKNDRGYQLKNFSENGWALVNLQNSTVIMNSGLPLKTASEFSGTRKTDAFTEMLANVVNDTAILYSAVKPKPSEAAPKNKAPVITNPSDKKSDDRDSLKTTVAINLPITAEPVKQTDSVLKSDTVLTQSTAIIKAPPVITSSDSSKAIDSAITNKVISDKPFITKIAEKKTDEVYQAIYLEQYNFSTDTIKIIIPLTDSTEKNSKPALVLIENKNDSAPDLKKADDKKAVSSNPAIIDTASFVKKTLQIVNSDCKDFATDYDVDKLRVKLLHNETIDDKLATAKKYFKTKCLSVKQIKALTELFPSDETKYRFFDISYPFVSDTNNFYLLEDLIQNDYYKNRFKAMIQK